MCCPLATMFKPKSLQWPRWIAIHKPNGDRSRSRSEKRIGNQKGAEMEEESMGSLTCKICQCVFCDEDDKLIECGRCEKWECINCSQMTEKQYYDLLHIELN